MRFCPGSLHTRITLRRAEGGVKPSRHESVAGREPVRWIPVALILLASLAETAPGSDTGHHADLTRDALQEAGFQRDAIRVVQVSNWLTDYYSNQPLAGINQNIGEIKAEVEKLHFDSREAAAAKLTDFDSISRYWAHLSKNTHDAVQKAATANDPLMLLSVLGISLHAVQDFYSHTNWVEKHPPQAANAPFRTETWFSELGKGPIVGLSSGRYPNVGEADDNHGTYTGKGMNHDSYVRCRWQQAYVFAFAATVQWVHAVKEWSDEADPNFWTKAQTLVAPAGLDADVEALDPDLRVDHHRPKRWPLEGQRQRQPGRALALRALAWTGSTDSPVVKQFKVAKVYALLTPGLYNDVGIAFPPVRRVAVHRELVSVRTLEVHAKDDLNPLEPAIDPLGDPDFYAVVTIEGNPYLETTQFDRAAITPSWTSCRFLPPGTDKAAVVYSLFDEDGAVRGDDDHCDINPDVGILDLSLSFSLADVSRSVTTEGVKPDKDRAVVSFSVKTDSVAPLPPLSITASVGMGAVNNADDVSTVQELLNVVPPDQGGPVPPLAVDGLIGPNTIKAINKFQIKQLGFQDGRVDPGKDTIKRLNEF